MSGIQIAALFTSFVGLLLVGGLIWQIAPPASRSTAALLVLLGLPLSISTFHLVRMPLDAALLGVLGKDSPLLYALRLCYAPLTEEPAKLLPLLLLLTPAFRGSLRRETVAPVALALGLGFAVGEMWLVAQFVDANPKFAAMPATAFGGFVAERLQTCLTHGGFTLCAVWGIHRGGWRIAAGLLGAMTLHFLGNFPIALMQLNFLGLGQPTWGALVGLWTAFFAAGSLVAVVAFHYGPAALWKLVGAESYCPDCKAFYKQPWLALNCGMLRYEPCPRCRRWHWIDARDRLRPPTEPASPEDPPPPSAGPSA